MNDPYNFVEKERKYERIYSAIGLVAGILGFLGLIGGMALMLLLQKYSGVSLYLLPASIASMTIGFLCFSQHRRMSMAIACVVGIVALSIMGSISVLDVVEENQRTQLAIGTIVDVQYTNTTVNGVPEVELTIEYTTENGAPAIATTRVVGSYACGVWLEEGTQVPIYYNESKPENVTLATELKNPSEWRGMVSAKIDFPLFPMTIGRKQHL